MSQDEGITPLSDFNANQWWVKELDAIFTAEHGSSINVTHDMRRAVAVVHNLLRSVAAATAAQPVRWNATRMDPDTIRLTSSEGETQVFKRPTGDSAPESEHLVWRMACKLVDGPTTGATGEQP